MKRYSINIYNENTPYNGGDDSIEYKGRTEFNRFIR